RLGHERQALEGRQAEARIWLQLTDRSDLERVGAEARYQSNFKSLYYLLKIKSLALVKQDFLFIS
ncbi:MAG: hypothetical protein LRY71_04615, partial [Bacillaceae bacterium]|nr:hypothetical protein [Bacillaceae bacterium]